MKILAFAATIIVFVFVLADLPYFFRYRSLHFVYRSGLLLYSRIFKVSSQTNKFSIPRWKIEHWMVASGFYSPMAEEDGEERYILMEFFTPLDRPIPLLMRAKVCWDNKEKNVIVRGYATWTYSIILAVLVSLFFIPQTENQNICFSILLLMYLFWCGTLYLSQAQKLRSIGTKVAEYLSTD